ncbi:structural maintenance of chromosomes 6 isoform X2 [Rhodnius prolixus]|uniref:structural maintenance of chromosomes 6 isoform X2 n=1 Tax=Rhodnius prolixus TaxID=13249 RepID=UPI003D18F50D
MTSSDLNVSSVRKKRTRTVIQNVNGDFEEEAILTRRQRMSNDEEDSLVIFKKVAGKVKRIKLHNFMCHGNLEFNFGERINFLSGKNGSGKSAILTALVIGLGGRTTDTNRGHSLKDLIKNGQNSGSIEITLFNESDTSYNKAFYGNEITVIRKINEKTSDYKFLSEKGKVISTKKDELSFMLSCLNIQINNPICILNQDVARTFLKSTSPSEFYRLFCKGTLIEFVTDKFNKLYKELLPHCRAKYSRNEKELQESSKDIIELKRKLEKQKELCKFNKELESISNELHWSYVTSLENDIEKEEKLIEEYKQSLTKLSAKVTKRETVVQELLSQKKIIEGNLKSLKSTNQENENFILNIESELLQTKELILRKVNEIKRIETKKGNAIKNCLAIEELITKQESHSKEIEMKRNELKMRKEELKQKRDELKAVLSTADLHRQQLSDTVNACNESVSNKKRFLANISNSIRYKEQYLQSLKKGMDQLSVFAPWMPELIEEIKLAHSQGKFEQIPRGPIGYYMKVKEKDWGPAIESFFGSKSLRSFCVHSNRDYKVLENIFEKLNLPKKQRPSVTISKFFSQVHNVKKYETRSEKYRSLLHGLSITDPVVANSVIDQWQIEKILLIPSNAEAYPLMENINNVPVNCQRALTKTGDTFFPQPNYKSYSGNVNEQARFLQVNPEEIIRLTEEELEGKRKEFKRHQEEIKELDNKLKIAKVGLTEAEIEVKKINTQLANCDVKLVETEQENVPEDFNVDILSEDLKHWKGNLNSCEKSMKEIEETKEILTEKAKDLKFKMDQLEQKKKESSEKLLEAENELTRLKKEHSKVNDNHDHYATLLKSEETKLEAHKLKFAELSKELEEAKKDAIKVCPERIDNPRSLEVLKEKKTDLRRMINALQKIVSENFIEPADFEFRMKNFDDALSVVQFQGDLLINNCFLDY